MEVKLKRMQAVYQQGVVCYKDGKNEKDCLEKFFL